MESTDSQVSVPAPKTISIRRLKDYAFTQLPKESVLRQLLLLEESDDIDLATFLARLPVYLRLSALERGGHK